MNFLKKKYIVIHYILLLASDGRIIIYGGEESIGTRISTKMTPNLAVLNTQITPFEWTTPQILLKFHHL